MGIFKAGLNIQQISSDILSINRRLFNRRLSKSDSYQSNPSSLSLRSIFVQSLLIAALSLSNAAQASNIEAGDNAKALHAAAKSITDESQTPEQIVIPTNSITTSIRTFNLRDPDVFEEIWVALAPAGMRVRAVNNEFAMVKNFDERRVWLQNLKKRFQHEVDVAAFERNFPELTSLLTGAVSQSNILGVTACADFKAELAGERTWRGLVVEEWHCADEEGRGASVQYMSKRWGLVVRVEFPDLMVEEAVNIQPHEFQQGAFAGEDALKQVDLSYFFEGRKKLEQYKN